MECLKKYMQFFMHFRLLILDYILYKVFTASVLLCFKTKPANDKKV
jgi:hypothetical protein